MRRLQNNVLLLIHLLLFSSSSVGATFSAFRQFSPVVLRTNPQPPPPPKPPSSQLSFPQVQFPEVLQSVEIPVVPQNDGGINHLFSRVMDMATEFVKRSNFPLGGANASSGHGLEGHNYCRFTPTSNKIGKFANIHVKAFEMLTKEFNVPKAQVMPYLRGRLPEFCTRTERPLVCNPSARYRTIDGTCNNLVKPWWGSSFTEFDRLVPSLYDDGWNEPRGGGFHLGRGNLPNVRLVSVSVHPDYVNPDQRMTNMVPQFGQFLDHDMTLTPEADKKCCSKERNHVDCFNIGLSSEDHFYSQLPEPQSCMHFTRSTPYCFPNAEGKREQMNIVTAFVDASHVYASEPNNTHLLRAYYGGRFRTNALHSGFLPTVAEVQVGVEEKIHLMGHFYGGEERVNEMPGLTVLHTLYFREHNRLADQISSRRPHWDDETVFQEARRLLIAQWQNSVYGEYLPVILGGGSMRRYGLALDDNKLPSEYNQSLNPTIFHAFADAAYRFGHTLLNGIIRMMRGFQELKKYRIRDNFFNHEQISLNGGEGYDLILGGLMAQNSQSYDTFITEDVTNFLLKEKASDHGGDLISRNLQRGRDHGLPGYHMYRALCDLPGLTQSWTNRPNNIPEKVWRVLASLYQTPLDIDLFTGGLSEVPVSDGVTGHTFNCLKALQFRRAKSGDRFFFTHAHQPGSFSLDQMRAIRRQTLGNLICRNSKVQMTTKNVFKMPGMDNPMVACSDSSREPLDVDLFLQV